MEFAVEGHEYAADAINVFGHPRPRRSNEGRRLDTARCQQGLKSRLRDTEALQAHAEGNGEEFISGLPAHLKPQLRRLCESFGQLLRVADGGRPALARDDVARIADELAQRGWSQTAESILLVDYEEVPVSPRVFLSDPYYLGKFGEGLYPVNFRDLCWLADPKNRIMETILTGAVRWGKSSLAVFLLAYRLYLLSLLRNPQEHFGLMHGSSIRYGIFNIYKYKANEVYERLTAMVDESPYFLERFPRQNKDRSKQLNFPKHVSVLTGSTELHLLGETLIGAVLDEVNFMAPPKVTGRSRRAATDALGQAQKLYGALRVRLRNQFVGSPGGAAPYFLCLMSERRAQTDFLEKHIAEHGHEEGVAVISRAI